MENQEDEPFGQYLVVSVDYGTTYTGISFAMIEGTEFTIDEWPRDSFYEYPPEKTETALKVPSQIAYPTKNSKLVKQAWGYQIDSRTARCAWMKLLLDKNETVKEYDDPNLRDDIDSMILSMPGDKNVEAVTADYLREIYEYAKMKISDQLSQAIDEINIHFWFTMPAIWGPLAEKKTLEAAKEAGFGVDGRRDTISVIKEPEAAAFAVLWDTELDPSSSVKKNSALLVCDCGGGTVDLSVYQVIEPSPKIKLKEVCPAIGGKCGGTTLDRNLYKMMKERYGDYFASLEASLIGPGSDFMNDWERNKRTFGDPEKSLERMQLDMDAPDSETYDYDEGEIILTPDDMREIFDPVVQKIIGLLSAQCDKAQENKARITDVILVGGLGGSPYLQEKVRLWCRVRSIDLRIPEDSWSAVSRGALLRGLDLAMVEQRIARYHFGIPVTRPFIPGKDDESQAYNCPFYGKRARGYVLWCVDKGAEINDGIYTKIKLSVVLNQRDASFSFELLSCDQDDAPERDNDKSVQRLCNVGADLSKMDLTKFASRSQNEIQVVDFSFEVRIEQGKEGVLVFGVFAEDQFLGNAEASFRE